MESEKEIYSKIAPFKYFEIFINIFFINQH